MQFSLLPHQFRLATLTAVSLASAALPGAQSHCAPAEAADFQILVKPKKSMSDVAFSAVLNAHGARRHNEIPALGVRIVRASAGAAAGMLKALKAHADVEYAEPDFKAGALGTANDPYYAQGSEWHLAKIQAPGAWDLTTGAAAVTVAVVDSGVTLGHPDLAGKVLAGYDYVSNDNTPNDDNGHGTAVSGTLAPASNNGLGVAGVAWANPILPVKVLDANGSGNYSAIAYGITYAADHGARVINLSVGGTASSQTLQDAVNYAWSKGAVLVAAAGNNGNDLAVYPGACKNVVAVSATNSGDTKPAWSNYGSYVDLSAPGEDICSLSGTDAYALWSGTSFSSPVVSGVVALMISANPKLTNSAAVELLLKNCDDIGALGYDTSFGNGRVNALRAVAAAKNYVAPDTTAALVTITSPANGGTVSGSVNVTASATDNVGVVRLELYVDGQLSGQTPAPAASFPLNTLNYSNALHSIEVRAYDLAGNVGKSTLSVTVRNLAAQDKTAPLVSITSPANGSRILNRTLSGTLVSSDNVGVVRVELYVDGLLYGSTAASSPSFSVNTNGFSYGAHSLQSAAYDAAGNVGISALVTIYQ